MRISVKCQEAYSSYMSLSERHGDNRGAEVTSRCYDSRGFANAMSRIPTFWGLRHHVRVLNIAGSWIAHYYCDQLTSWAGERLMFLLPSMVVTQHGLGEDA